MENRKTHNSSSRNYSIKVDNFGPIVNAQVDLRPLTVFIGPSNTGKSYLAILIYALHQFFGAAQGGGYWRRARYRRIRHALSNLRSFEASKAVQESLANWLAGIAEGREPALPEDVVAAIRPVLERPQVDRELATEIRRCFGVEDHKDLVRQPGTRSIAKIGLAIPQESGSQAVHYVFEFGKGRPRFWGELPVAGPMTIGGGIPRELRYEAQFRMGVDDPSSSEKGRLVSVWLLLANLLFTSLTGPLTCDAFYLPADRTGVMHSHQVVVSTLIQNATTAGLQPSADVPMLSGVLADFLNELILISGQGLPKSSVALADIIETNILEGGIKLSRVNSSYPVFTYRPAGWKSDLPLMRTSSMVSELAPIVLYLRHLVRPGDLLIIEEPESHLHPAMQAAFARELARLVRTGIRVILTTHSEWFLEQLGNLVRFGLLPKEKQQGTVGADYALAPDDIGAWLFKRRQKPKGTVVSEVFLDSETGLFPTDFDPIREHLYNESADISDRLQGSTVE